MALVLADRVRETTAVVGTGTATLLGAIASYQSFAAIGNANTVYYTIVDQSTGAWEVGIGTYTASGTTLSRNTVLSSSNGGSLVNFSAGTKDVWGDYPAGKAVTTDTLAYPPEIGGTTPAAGTFTTLIATGQTSFGGVAAVESLRVNVSGGSAGSNNYVDVFGTFGSGNPLIASGGTGANAGLAFRVKGTGAYTFGTGSSATNIQFQVTNTASAVNYVQVAGAATTGLPQISSQGSDTNPGLLYITKGTGEHRFATNASSGNIQFRVVHTASAANYGTVTGAAIGASPAFAVAGSDTNIDLTLTPKGAGRVNITTSIKPKVNSATNVTSPLAWNSTSFDEYAITALANALTINADANASPADGQFIIFRFKDNGTARALTWTTGATNSFKAVGVTLPTTTVINKLLYVGCIYNAADSRWDAIAVSQET